MISPDTCAVKFAPRPRGGKQLDPTKVLQGLLDSCLQSVHCVGSGTGWLILHHAIDYLIDPEDYQWNAKNIFYESECEKCH